MQHQESFFKSFQQSYRRTLYFRNFFWFYSFSWYCYFRWIHIRYDNDEFTWIIYRRIHWNHVSNGGSYFCFSKSKSITTLLIIGMMMGYVAVQQQIVLTVLADHEKIAAFSIWTMGSFSGFTWDHVKILYIVSIPFLFLHS